MFRNRKSCFSVEAALIGKYLLNKAMASSGVEMPTTRIKLRTSSRSASPRKGSVTRIAFSFSANRYSADGTDTISPGGVPSRGNVPNSR